MRDDEFMWEPFGPAGVVRLQAGIDEDGGVVEWLHDGWTHTHDGRPSMDDPPRATSLLAAHHLARPFDWPLPPPPGTPWDGGRRNSVPLYEFPGQRIVDHYVPVAPLRVSALRSLGAHLNVFALESFIDEICVATSANPLELRLRYLADLRARAVIEAVVELAGWDPSEPARGERGRGLGFARYKNRAAYAAVIVEVELDTEVRVRRAWGAIDAGMVVSRDGLLNQLEGGIIQAVSWTLHEQVTADDNGITSRGWDTYRTLRFPDAPEVHGIVIDRPTEPFLGAGEAMTGPTAAAIGNAIYHVLGVRVRDMPITRERVIAAMSQAPDGAQR
jgi:CO/xanthine dehydrogenase Mo-binding subunit